MTTRRALLTLVASSATLSLHALAGSWAEASFANDGALDWVAEFAEKPSLDLVRKTLEKPLVSEYVDSMDGQAAIAAAEVVAASLGRAAPDFPREIVSATTGLKRELRSLANLARRAVSRVAGPKSELHELWAERQESLTRWQASVRQLLSRLSANAA